MSARGRSRGRGRSRSQRGGGMEAGRDTGVGSSASPDGGSAMPAAPAMPDAPAMPPTGGSVASPKQNGGNQPLNPAPYGAGEGGFLKSQYYTISGGSRRRRSNRKAGTKRKNRKYKGGNAVLASAAVPFGLLALQRYFKGSAKSKRGVAKMGRSFKRTFRRKY